VCTRPFLSPAATTNYTVKVDAILFDWGTSDDTSYKGLLPWVDDPQVMQSFSAPLNDFAPWSAQSVGFALDYRLAAIVDQDY